LSAVLFIAASLTQITHAEDPPFSIAATDTIAGYSSTIKVFDLFPKEKVTIRVEKPEGRAIESTEIADGEGIAELNFLGFHTKEAGIYEVRVYPENINRERTPSTTFEVFPDTASPLYSRIQVLQDVAPANGAEPIKIKIQLRDEHENAIPKHFIELISSRSEDSIETIGNGMTDSLGEITFLIRSEKEGVSHFSALDRNSGIILEERGKGMFFEVDDRSQGGNLFQASIFDTQKIIDDSDDDDDIPAEFGIIDHFLVEINTPDGNNLLQDSFSLKVIAMDREKNKVINYTGQIRIIADDPDVKLPGMGKKIDFNIDDQGEKNFELSVKFPRSGDYTISVIEFEEGSFTDVKGETEVSVFETCDHEGCSVEIPPEDEEIFIIDRPEEQGIYGSKTVIIKGKSMGNGQIQIYVDDRKEKIITPEEDGSFFDDKGIIVHEDGEHTLVLEDMELETKSSPITFFVDSTPPKIERQEIDSPDEIKEGDMFTVIIFSEADLSSVTLFLKDTDKRQKFLEDTFSPGKYTATMRAPNKAGEYFLNVELKDEFDHITTADKIFKIVVVSPPPELSPPKNVHFERIDTGKILLSWKKPENSGSGIISYHIFSGTDQSSLNIYTEVNADITKKEIIGIEEGETRYFSITALDSDKNESEMSDIISVTLKKEPPNDTDPPPDNTEKPIPIDVSNNVSIFPGDGEVELQWDPPKIPADFFDVRFGISSKKYTERFRIYADTFNATATDLINGRQYYITIVPLDANGVPTGEIYEEKMAVPVFSGLHSAPTPPHTPPIRNTNELVKKIKKTEETGAESFFLFFLSLSFTAAMFSFQQAFSLFRTPNIRE
jgi:fibronectin type 3 domain-containing protein